MKKVHFIGIGGVGMSATAKLLKDAGYTVTGSDEEVYAPMSDFLKKEAFDVRMPYGAANIPADVDFFVIGKNAKLVPETNAEVAAAYASGKPVKSFPDVLSELSKDKETIVAAGSYGKSTSTALLSHVLESAGTDPSYVIGASPLTPASSARLGHGNLFVLEGDEYPASNTDPRSKFLLMHPTHVLLTPLAHDHFNIFPTPADYIKPFTELITMPKTLVACIESPMSKELLAHAPNAVTYGVHEGTFHADNIVWGERTAFDISKGSDTIVHVETTQLGEHNIQNIIGVAALVFTLGLVTPEQFAAAVATFKGIRRRLDRKSEKTSVPIFEGFGSSYEKLHSAMAAMKLHFPDRRLVVVFEPHTFSWRNRESLAWYDTVFKGASEVFIFEPPHDGKDTQLSVEEMVARVLATGINTHGSHDPTETLTQLEHSLQKNDVILLSSSGAMGGLIESIPRFAEQRFPA